MLKAPRYKPVKLLTSGGNPLTYTPYGPEVVPAADYDATVDLLAKYRQHVQDCESIDFLDKIGASDVTFTPAEVAALMALRGEEYGYD